MSLFDEIGGEAAVNAAVDLFYRKVLRDPRISSFFDGERCPPRYFPGGRIDARHPRRSLPAQRSPRRRAGGVNAARECVWT